MWEWPARIRTCRCGSIGKPPASFSLAALPLQTPPPLIPAGVPSQLLERRPDIASAERQMAAANAQIGVAKAAYYPLLNLTAAGGVESAAIDEFVAGARSLITLVDLGVANRIRRRKTPCSVRPRPLRSMIRL